MLSFSWLLDFYFRSNFRFKVTSGHFGPDMNSGRNQFLLISNFTLVCSSSSSRSNWIWHIDMNPMKNKMKPEAWRNKCGIIHRYDPYSTRHNPESPSAETDLESMVIMRRTDGVAQPKMWYHDEKCSTAFLGWILSHKDTEFTSWFVNYESSNSPFSSTEYRKVDDNNQTRLSRKNQQAAANEKYF